MNHEKYASQGCTAVLDQTYRNIEIIYADNNSKDRTFEIADELFRKSGLPYKGFKRTENYGISANVNFLLQHARGEFIAFLSADDWWANDHIQNSVDLFTANPDYGLIYSNGHLYKQSDASQFVFYEQQQPSGWVFNKLLQGNFIHAVSAVIRSEVLKKVGGFDENSPIEDWEMWLRISEKYQVGYVHQPSVFYRVTGNNLTSNLDFMNKGFDYIFKKYAAHPEVSIAKKNIKLGQAYQLASTKPGFASLRYILKNYQWNLKYTKHVVRCLLGMAGWKDKKHLKKQP
jgi:alpha-1,3-rhamnosyltransferase